MAGVIRIRLRRSETVLSKGLLKSHFALEDDGTVKVPDTPGLGIEIDETAVEKYRIS